MSDMDFKEVIFGVAEKSIQRPLVSEEKQRIITAFNTTKHGNAYVRAKNAIKDVFGEDVMEPILVSESEGANNNWANIIAELKIAADKWAKR
ncbi:MAG: hypothetical protein LBC59_01955 [Chitinispirillales bacterium]|jgi:hypothetical protein|nr:hypothetical protein [Chitinispirillales bacterium]